jgi:hypothetical protein
MSASLADFIADPWWLEESPQFIHKNNLFRTFVGRRNHLESLSETEREALHIELEIYFTRLEELILKIGDMSRSMGDGERGARAVKALQQRQDETEEALMQVHEVRKTYSG